MIERISRGAFRAKIERGDDFVLIDTLSAKANRKGHLTGAMSIPSDDVLTEGPRRVSERDSEIIVYSGSGPRRRPDNATERLIRLGYTRVRDYRKGKADWVAAGLPLQCEPDRRG